MREKISLTFCSLILALFFLFQNVSAQSGRTVPPSEITPEPAPIIETKAENPVCEESVNEIEFIDLTERDEFIKRINHYGSCGYRLETVARLEMWSNSTLEQMSFAGLVRKETGSQYEYNWFVTESPGRAQTLANNLADKGFYLKKAFPFVIDACSERADRIRKENDKDSTVLGRLNNFAIGDEMIFFLFERKVGNLKKNEYKIIDAEIPGTKFVENIKKMQDLTAKGFRPVDLWYIGFLQYHFVIMEKDEAIEPRGEYIFDKELYGVTKDLNKYAEKGYELSLMGTGLSILNRTDSSPRPVKYYAFDDFKKLKKNFPSIQRNAALVETGLDFGFLLCDYNERKWFFTVPLNAEKNLPQKETLFLNMSEVYSEYKRKNSILPKTELTKGQLAEIEKDMTRRINQLLKENYELKNFNFLTGLTFMFERIKK